MIREDPRPGAAPSHFELRGDARVGTDLPVQIHLSELPAPLPARARDIGVGGVCVATPTMFSLKSVRRVVIGMPSGPVTLDAEGRWQYDANADDLVLSGLAFSHTPPEIVDVLSGFVLENGRALARFLYAESDLRDFGLEEVLGLAQITRFRDVAAGRCLYREGTSREGEDSVFVVARGAVTVLARARGAREVPLAQLGPGQLLGGLPLVADTPHPETASADVDTRLLEVDREAFRYLERSRPWLAQRLAGAVVRTYARRLHDMLGRIRDKL